MIQSTAPRMRLAAIAVPLCTSAACFGGVAGAGITPIPNLPGWTHNVPTGLSGDGATVVGYAGVGGRTRPFRWTAATGSMDLIGPDPTRDAYAYAVSYDGSAIVGTAAVGPAWRWDAGVGLSLLSNATQSMSFSQSISGSGEYAAGAVDGIATLWPRTGSPIILGTLGGNPSSEALAVNFDGTAATGVAGSAAFRWTSAGGMQPLGLLPGYSQLLPLGMSYDGTRIVGSASTATGQSVPFLWTETTGTVELPSLTAGGSTLIWEISGDGTTVVGLSDGGAYFWTEQTGAVEVGALLASRGVNMTGWFLIDASGVSADGSVITGSGIFNGVSQGYIAVIPAPGATLLAVVAAGWISRRRRHAPSR